MIELRDVSVGFGDRRVLSGATYRFEPDTVYVLRGASGLGKSTVLNLAAGYLEPASGTVTATRPLEYLLQENLLFSELTVAQNLRIRALALTRRPAPASGTAYGPGADSSDTHADDHADVELVIERTLERLGLGGRGAERVGSLSGGERRRVELAGMLLLDPAVMLLDEPVANLDPATAREVYAALWSIREGRTIVVVTHESDLSALPGPVHEVTIDGGRLEDL